VSTATLISTKMSSRLPNSILPWIAYARVGTSESSVQVGHVGQPSPESVSRTIPPVSTIRQFATTDAHPSRRTHPRRAPVRVPDRPTATTTRPA
jgi:hypothetical protein